MASLGPGVLAAASGGAGPPGGDLLLATAAPEALVAELERRDAIAAVAGQVTAGPAGHVEVRL
jgi:hypothetical protein